MLRDVVPVISDDGDVIVEQFRRVGSDELGERRRIIGCFCCESKYPTIKQYHEIVNIHCMLLLLLAKKSVHR